MKDLVGKKITARVVAEPVDIAGPVALLIQTSDTFKAGSASDGTMVLGIPPGSAFNVLEDLEEVREPISSLPVGTFVEVTRINVGDDDAPAHLKGQWRGIVLGGEVLRLLDLSVTDPEVFQWRSVALDNIVEWRVVE